MLAPIDKLRPGAGGHPANDIMDIEVTRACDKTCRNCTRLLQYRANGIGELTDPVHMSLDVFRLACRSLADWPGCVVLIGGNPCTHPRFDELCAIMIEEIPDQARRGLWTNNLLGHGEIAARTFGRFNLNVHHDTKAADEMRRWLPGRPIFGEAAGRIDHSMLLADYRDYGISREEWVAAREGCDINQHWSGTVREVNGKPYGWFCEFASMIDAVRGENHGVEISPGWWKQSMASFAHQVSGCCDRGCGVPLKLAGGPDTDPVYDISPSLVQVMIKRRGNVRTIVHERPPGAVRENTDYAHLRSP